MQPPAGDFIPIFFTNDEPGQQAVAGKAQTQNVY